MAIVNSNFGMMDTSSALRALGRSMLTLNGMMKMIICKLCGNRIVLPIEHMKLCGEEE